MELTNLRLGRGQEGLAVWRDPYTHLFCIGKSGSGKSNLLVNMIQQDSYYPTSKIILDPTGFMAGDARSIIKNNCIYSTIDEPVGMNPMLVPYDDDVKCDLISEGTNQYITRCANNEILTVAMRGILTEQVKWNINRNRNSLIHVMDSIALVKNSPTARDGLLARLKFILDNEAMRKMICGDALNIPELIDKRKTLILNMHGFSEEQFIFAGTILLNTIKAHFRYGKVKEYKPLRVFVDEFHNFASLSILNILKEARKFRLSFILSTTDFAGLDQKIVHSICNVGSLVAFKCGNREAQILAREFDIQPQDLQFIEKYHFYYLTPRDRGFAKAPSPPYIRKLEMKKAVPPRKAKWRGWFPLESDLQSVPPMSGGGS